MTSFAVASFTRDVSRGFAMLLADAGIGFAWSDTADYAADQVGIFTDIMPPAPDQLVLITSNQLSADPQLAQSIFNVQFRSRATRAAGADEASGMGDVIQDALLGRVTATLPNGVRLWSINYGYGGPLGPDANGRPESSSNFTVGVYRPGTHRK